MPCGRRAGVAPPPRLPNTATLCPDNASSAFHEAMGLPKAPMLVTHPKTDRAPCGWRGSEARRRHPRVASQPRLRMARRQLTPCHRRRSGRYSNIPAEVITQTKAPSARDQALNLGTRNDAARAPPPGGMPCRSRSRGGVRPLEPPAAALGAPQRLQASRHAKQLFPHPGQLQSPGRAGGARSRSPARSLGRPRSEAAGAARERWSDV